MEIYRQSLARAFKKIGNLSAEDDWGFKKKLLAELGSGSNKMEIYKLSSARAWKNGDLEAELGWGLKKIEIYKLSAPRAWGK